MITCAGRHLSLKVTESLTSSGVAKGGTTCHERVIYVQQTIRGLGHCNTEVTVYDMYTYFQSIFKFIFSDESAVKSVIVSSVRGKALPSVVLYFQYLCEWF